MSKKSAWKTLRVFIADGEGRKPAVKLTMRMNGRMCFSHTLGFVRDSKFEPILHVPDNHGATFLALLQKSMGEAHVMLRNAEKAATGSLSTPMPEVMKVR